MEVARSEDSEAEVIDVNAYSRKTALGCIVGTEF